MSADKPKVYQGVRVKTTVKELLQKHRALQAQKITMKSQAMDGRNDCSATLNTHLDIFSERQAPESYFQTRPYTENANIQMENAFDHQQMMNMMPPETFSGSNIVCPTSAQWSNGYIPSNTDIYGANLVSSSPSDSLNLPSPVDYNSYSPPQSHSSSSSCYSSPTRMDLSSNFSPENYHYQHCNLQHCFCLSHWSSLQDGMPTSEYAPYGSSDCMFSYSDDNYFRRNISNSDMCYL
ncbi:POU Class 2 homeobox-associating factor 3-like isoform X2 [Xyrauchen texanus]|uniref:POU Class 2 homeobox-associating factor 3-like isoform X2 n=1 Tax=Xyrauchen texanus TaxID=154827 RepID=UPI00224215CB|nr:POU Class 2 homeobox-associating factor 3-like isoform X2 [Xyrauchen texanus]